MIDDLLGWVKGIFEYSYATELENYITMHNPKDTADVERLTMQYNQRMAKENFSN